MAVGLEQLFAASNLLASAEQEEALVVEQAQASRACAALCEVTRGDNPPTSYSVDLQLLAVLLLQVDLCPVMS